MRSGVCNCSSPPGTFPVVARELSLPTETETEAGKLVTVAKLHPDT